MPPSTGVADLPGFTESLDLLLHREQYTYTDIAMMFGVSRQRIEQLAERMFPNRSRREGWLGMRSLRVWDDNQHRFIPIPKGVLRKHARETKRHIRAHVRQGYRDHVLAVLSALPTDRPITLRELWKALSDQDASREAAQGVWIKVCAMLGVPVTYGNFRTILAAHGLRLYQQGYGPAESMARRGKRREEAPLHCQES